MIKLDCTKQIFKVRAIKGTAVFREDVARIKSIIGRTPRWQLDPVTKRDTLLHWEIPRHSVQQLVENWTLEEIIATPAAQVALDRYRQLVVLPQDLPPIPESEVDWGCLTPNPQQKKYVLINRQKTALICSFFYRMGKSPAAIWRAQVLGFKKLILVCPGNYRKRLAKKWAAEFIRLIGVRPLMYGGTVKQRQKLRETEIPNASITIVSYALAKELAEFEWDQLIADEAHLASHFKTKARQGLVAIIRNNPDAGIQLLTATPINHKIDDLWGLVHLISPEIAGPLSLWREQFTEVLWSIQKWIRGRRVTIPIKTRMKNKDELIRRIAPIMVREVPESGYEHRIEIVPVELTEKQQLAYRATKRQIEDEIKSYEENQDKMPPHLALKKMSDLLEICEGLFNVEDESRESAKLQWVCDELDEAIETGEKIVIWSRYRAITSILYAKYKERAVLYNGTISSNLQNLGVLSFQGIDNEEDQRLFDKYVADLKKAGTDWPFKSGEAQFLFGVVHPNSALGFDLYAADRQIFSSFHLQGTADSQAWARLYKIAGQGNEILTQFVVAKNTVEPPTLSLVMHNYQETLDVLDGKASRDYKKTSEIIKILKGAA